MAAGDFEFKLDKITMDLKPRDTANWGAIRHAGLVEIEKLRVMAGGLSENLPVETALEVGNSAEIKP